MNLEPKHLRFESGGAATSIAAQGFNPGNGAASEEKKGGALARGFCQSEIVEEYLAGPPDLSGYSRRDESQIPLRGGE